MRTIPQRVRHKMVAMATPVAQQWGTNSANCGLIFQKRKPL